MKILYLSHRIPFPPNKGDKIRSFHQVKHLAARHHLDLVCLADDPDDVKYASDLRQLCQQVHVEPIRPLLARVKGLCSLLRGGSVSVGYFYRRSVQKIIDHWLSEVAYDLIICFSSSMAEYVFRSSTLGQSRGAKPRLFMDFCDVDSDKWRQYASNARFPANSIYSAEFRRMQAYEHKIHRAFDATILISGHEADLFARNFGSASGITVIPNGIDWRFFHPGTSNGDEGQSATAREKSPCLVFTGAMDYHANIDGVTWFCNEILPQIHKRIPEVNFKIVGSNPPPVVKNLASRRGVEVTGFVEDIRPYYAMADVCVMPLRMARGIQNKLLEAMAMERAVVTTSAANSGVQAQNGEQLLVANSPGDFATAVVELLNSPIVRASLGKNARRYVVNQFDWEKNLLELDDLLVYKPTNDSLPEVSPFFSKSLSGQDI